MRISRLQKKKEARLRWSRNANAAKARKRLERERMEPLSSGSRLHLVGYEITIKCLSDGSKVSFRPKSINDMKRRAAMIVANYLPG